jgi:hypothetical protein
MPMSQLERDTLAKSFAVAKTLLPAIISGYGQLAQLAARFL